jgi:IS5 family transposase
MVRLPDESTILRFRHLLETHGLAVQMLALVNEILTEKGLIVWRQLQPPPTTTKIAALCCYRG